MSSQQTRRSRPDRCQQGQRRARQIASARRMCRNVAGFTDPFTLECWASTFLGRLWEQRERVGYDDGWAFLLGGPVVEDIAEVGGRGAKAALMAVSRLDPTIFGVICRDLAAQLTDVALPHWFDQVGRLTISEAAWTGDPDDAEQDELILLGARRPHAVTHALVVAVDHAQGIATHLGPTWPYEQALAKFHRQEQERGGTHPFSEVELRVACRQAAAAMQRTDACSTPDLDHLYPDVRALAYTYLRSQVESDLTRR